MAVLLKRNASKEYKKVLLEIAGLFYI